jgi:hypothetical protein
VTKMRTTRTKPAVRCATVQAVALLIASVGCTGPNQGAFSSSVAGAESGEINPPPPNFEAEVDPWPLPHRTNLELVRKASRARIAGEPLGSDIVSRVRPDLFARDGHIGGFDYLEVILGKCKDPDAAFPLLVLLHGRGGRPRIPAVRLFDLPTPIRIFIPRAPDPLGDGFTWLATYTRSGDDSRRSQRPQRSRPAKRP